MFREQNLSITIEVGLARVNFLDVTLDLTRGIYKPYRKPGDKPQYVNAWSNHPPRVLENIPIGINKRLEVGLAPCSKLVWMEGELPHQSQKRKRSRKVMWFNPPHSIIVKTDVINSAPS